MLDYIKKNWRKLMFRLFIYSRDYAFQYIDENKDSNISKKEWDTFFKKISK